MTLQGFQDQPLVGRTIYLFPTVEEQTRTTKVRIQFANRAGRLKPGMFADDYDSRVLVVHSSAPDDRRPGRTPPPELPRPRFAKPPAFAASPLIIP